MQTGDPFWVTDPIQKKFSGGITPALSI